MPSAAKIPAPIATYYKRLAEVAQHDATNEGAVRDAFQTLLGEWGRSRGLTVLAEQYIDGQRKRSIRVDGLLVDALHLRRGIWEAKDKQDNLEAEITLKIAAGYPLTNILFEDTRRGVLYQDGNRVMTVDLQKPDELRVLLDRFLDYSPARIEQFHRAVARFRDDIPALAASLTALIDEAKRDNPAFVTALADFLAMCQKALNPATTAAEVEDMLKQHLLTERIFRGIFHNPDFVRRNAVAGELERMVDALTSRSFSREAFLRALDYFYEAIEAEARTIPPENYDERQELLRTLYEQFFQAYSTRAADTHGIVYTPPEIVAFMVRSVEQALQNEFGRDLATPGTRIIDPCVGTGTFIVDLLRRIPRHALAQKYADELFANEVLLLPYYIAAQNIEHAYMEEMKQYAPFAGLCFTDTLDLADSPQLDMFATQNSQRVEREKAQDIFVVIGNPPYNVGQERENDNNKNRKYPTVDGHIRDSYVKNSHAALKRQLYDPYVKFFRWATDRLGNHDGIVCFVSNNSFLNQVAFDGMRKHLLQDFTRIYTFDLGGNVRKNPKLSGTRHNVFGIQVGVTITLLIRNAQHIDHKLFYARLDEFWTKEQKLRHLTEAETYTHMQWVELAPDERNTWIREGLRPEFEAFLPIASKEAKGSRSEDVQSIFKTYSLGVFTGRDQWAYEFEAAGLSQRIRTFIDSYNEQVSKWTRRQTLEVSVDRFVNYDDKLLKWSDTLKQDLQRGRFLNFSPLSVREAIYRPFTKKFLYYANGIIDRPGTIGTFFPTPKSEQENSAIWLKVGSEWPMFALTVNRIVDLLPQGGSRCFPFYTYAEGGSEQRENITDWALGQFRTHYSDDTISKWDIFNYVYAVLHHPTYRATYAENLKRDLPHIPFVPTSTFRAFVETGARLAALHRDYQQVEPYPLRLVEDRNVPFTWRVDERGMRLSSDRAALRVNAALTLEGIPPEVFSYRLGNRSALDWVIDQYRPNTDPRSGLTHDPNDPNDPEAIVRLVRQVVRVSLETVVLVAALPPLN